MGPIERTHWELDTRLPPESVTDALVDFSPRRELIWKETCDPAVYRVHAVGDTWAEVTEGVVYAWSRERYDWSTPGVVTLTQLDANIAAPVGTIRYTISALPDGGARIACDRYRLFRGARGRLLGTFMVLLGPRVLRRQFRVSLERVARGSSRVSDETGRSDPGPPSTARRRCRAGDRE